MNLDYYVSIVIKRKETMDLRLVRNYAELSQDEFAKRLGVSRGTYNTYENGRNNSSRAEYIKFLGRVEEYIKNNFPHMLNHFTGDGENDFKDKDKILAYARSLSVMANSLIECLEDK
jgi:transcriptional regulator with XRE-family HTH domain